MSLIKVIIEKANDGGYAAYAPAIAGGLGSGLTEDEAKEDFLQVIEEQAEYYKERTGIFPQWYQNGYNIEYRRGKSYNPFEVPQASKRL